MQCKQKRKGKCNSDPNHAILYILFLIRRDIYSLGVIFFEMLYKMETQMERHEVLQALRKGEFPQGFEQNNLIEVIITHSPFFFPHFPSSFPFLFVSFRFISFFKTIRKEAIKKCALLFFEYFPPLPYRAVSEIGNSITHFYSQST